MKKLIVMLLLCVLIPLGLAEDTFSKVLPADGIGFAYIDVQQYIKDVNEFNGLFDAFSKDEELGEFVKPLLEKLEEKLKEIETEEEFDFDIKKSISYLKTEMALYIGGAQYMKSEGVPSALFIMKTGDNSDEVAHIVQVLTRKLAEEEDEVTAGIIEIGDAEFTQLTFSPSEPEEDNDDMFEGMDEEWKKQLQEQRKKEFENQKKLMAENPAIIGVHNDVFVICNSKPLLTRFFENLADEEAESLAETDSFKKTMGAVKAEGSPFTLYVSVDQLVALMKKLPTDSPDEEQEKLEVITKVMKWGFSDVSSVGLAAVFEKKTLTQRMFVSFPEEKYGIMRVLLSGEGMPNLPLFLDEKTFLLSGFKFNVVDLYAEVIKMLTAMDPTFISTFEANKTQMKTMQGIDLDQLITSLGGTVAVFQVPNKNLKNDEGEKEKLDQFIQKGKSEFSVIALELANNEPLTAVLGKFLDVEPYNGMFPSEEFMGTKIYQLKMMAAGSPVVPGFAIYKNFLLFSDSATEVQNAIRRGESKEFTLAKTLVESLDIVKAMKPDGGLAGFSLPGGRNNLVAQAYEKEFRMMAGEFFKEINDELEINLSVENLPSYDKIKKYINMNQYVRGGMIEGGYLIFSQSVNAEEAKAE